MVSKNIKKFLYVILIVSMMITGMVNVTIAESSNNAVTWEVKDDRQGRSFADIVTFNNKLIAVGANGLIMVSSDGAKWNEVKADTKAHFIGIVTDGKKAVAATNDGNVFISADGENWKVKSIAVDVPVYKLVFVNSKYILLGTNFTIMFSDDGVKWTNMTKNYEGTKYDLSGITYNPDKSEWVLGEYKTIIVTKDFKSFEEYSVPNNCFLCDIGYLKGKYIIASSYGYIFDTYNLVDFNQSKKFVIGRYLDNFRKLVMMPNYFLAIGGSGSVVQGTSATSIDILKKVANDYKYYQTIAIFKYDYYIVSSNGCIEKSKSDSIYWNSVLDGIYDILYIEAIEDKFLAYSRLSQIYLSNSDYTFKRVADFNESITSYSFIDGKYYLKGGGGVTLESLDLINWKSRSASNDFVISDFLEYNKNLYAIAGSEYKICYFDDGYKDIVDYRFHQNSLETFKDKIISVGNYGEGYIIDKSKKFKKINMNKESAKKIRYLNNELIAVNEGGKISVSTDGVNWETKLVDSKTSFSDITYGNGLYVLVGDNGTILTSLDLNTWYKNDSTVGNNLTSIAFGNGKFVIGGAQNTILVSKDMTASKNKVISKKVEFDPVRIYVYVDNKEVQFDQQPVIKEGRTLAPLRKVFEALGAKVTWDDATRTAIGKNDGVEVKVQIGSTTAYVNGKAVTLDVPAEIMNGRTLVPLRFISESFNSKVTWEDFSRSIYIDEE